MKDFILNIWNAYTLIDVTLILFFAILSLFYFLRLKQAKNKLKNYSFFSTCSAEKILDYENQIKLQECQIADVKKYFEDAVAEITELRSKAKLSQDELRIAYERIEVMQTGLKEYFNKIKLLQTKLSRSTQPRDSQGHFIKNKQINYEYFEYIGFKYNPYSPNYFENGESYKFVKNAGDDLFYLIDLLGKEKLVERKFFKPVVK